MTAISFTTDGIGYSLDHLMGQVEHERTDACNAYESWGKVSSALNYTKGAFSNHLNDPIHKINQAARNALNNLSFLLTGKEEESEVLLKDALNLLAEQVAQAQTLTSNTIVSWEAINLVLQQTKNEYKDNLDVSIDKIDQSVRRGLDQLSLILDQKNDRISTDMRKDPLRTPSSYPNNSCGFWDRLNNVVSGGIGGAVWGLITGGPSAVAKNAVAGAASAAAQDLYKCPTAKNLHSERVVEALPAE